LPSTHGFQFSNTTWGSEHITSISLPDPFGDILIGQASWGLCGGMSFASRDYFEAGMWAPDQATNPPGEGDPLFNYIVQRLSQSLNVGDAADFVKYADPLYPDTDDITGLGRDWVMAHVAWPGIRNVIDSGHPCPIGIVIGYLPNFTGLGHQVCVYGYQLIGQVLTLWMYDPNSPLGDDVKMTLDLSRTDQLLFNVTSNINVPHSPTCFFTQSYERRDPVMPRRPATALDVFWLGPDGAAATNWANPNIDAGAWHQPFPISPPNAARSDSPIAAVTRFGGALDTFWIGPDGGIGTTWANPLLDRGVWHPPFPIAPPRAARSGSGLSAVTRFAGALDVFWIGPDGAVGTTWANLQVDNGVWHPPFPITPPGATRGDAPVIVVTRFDGALDVFWIGPDGAIATTWANPHVDNGVWHQPFPFSPPGAARERSPLAVVARLSGALDAFWIGPDGGIGTTWANPQVDDGVWHKPFPITPPGAAGPAPALAATTRLGGALDVFWVGPDGAVATTWANPRVDNGAWHTPFPITPPRAARDATSLGVVSRFTGALDVFWTGPDGAVGTTWANPQIGRGTWHPPFLITPPGATRATAPIAVVTR
jgi:hypothetical protein